MTQSPPKKAAARPVRTQPSRRTVRAVQFQPPTEQAPTLDVVMMPTAPTPEPEATEPLMDPEPEVEEEEQHTAADEPADDTDEDEATEQDSPQEESDTDEDIVIGPLGYPTHIRGIEVVREQALYAIGPHAPFRYTRLFLADGTSCIACRDCWWDAPSRGEVMQHRNTAHGARYGRKKPKVDLPPVPEAPELIVEPRDDNTPAPNNPLDWTLRELLAVLPDIAALGNLVDTLEKERDDALAELAASHVGDREAQHKIAVYDSHRQEIIELRKFKRDVEKQFAKLGFKTEVGQE